MFGVRIIIVRLLGHIFSKQPYGKEILCVQRDLRCGNFGSQRIVACPLKAGIVYPEETSVVRLWHSKFHVSVATIMHATIEELWEAVFSVSLCGDYIWRIETQSL
jgi:hypothetical protein